MNELYQFHLRPEEDLFHGLIKWLLLLLIFVRSKILKFLAEIVRRNFIEQDSIFTRVNKTIQAK